MKRRNIETRNLNKNIDDFIVSDDSDFDINDNNDEDHKKPKLSNASETKLKNYR